MAKSAPRKPSKKLSPDDMSILLRGEAAIRGIMQQINQPANQPANRPANRPAFFSSGGLI